MNWDFNSLENTLVGMELSLVRTTKIQKNI